MSTIGGDNGVSMGGYNYGVATLKYCYISAGSKGRLNSYNLRRNTKMRKSDITAEEERRHLGEDNSGRNEKLPTDKASTYLGTMSLRAEFIKCSAGLFCVLRSAEIASNMHRMPRSATQATGEIKCHAK
jgi:hypothetical protein